MRQFLTLAALSMALSAPAGLARAEASQVLAPDFEACIRDNAAKVEAAEPDLTKAVDYLVFDVCAMPLANDRQRQAQQIIDKQKADRQALCDQQKALRSAAEKSNDEDSGDDDFNDINSCVLDAGYEDSLTTVYITGFAAQQQKPAPAAALASQLLLDLRLSHSTSGSSH